MADEYDLEVGDTIDWEAFEVAEEGSESLLNEDGTPVHLRVVGVGVYPNEVVATAPYDSLPFIYLTPAYFDRHQRHTHVYGFYAIRLRNGQADAAAFRATLSRTLREFGVNPQGIPLSTRFERNAQVERAIEPQAIALWTFAALTGAALLIVIIQVLARQILLDADEYRALQTLGMSRRQLFAGAMVRVGVVALGGAAIAVVGAALASPLLPIGPARLAEPNPGFAFNAAILGAGFVVIWVLVVALAAIPAWRSASIGASRVRESREAHEPSSRLTAAAASAGLPPTSTIGVRNAVRPGIGRSRVPVRSAIAVNSAAIALVVAAVAFTGNLTRLADTPKDYGWDWTFKVGSGTFGVDPRPAIERLREDPSVEAAAMVNYGTARIGGHEVAAVGVDSRIGSLFPTLLEGREAVRDDEIVLGTRTLRRAHRSVGESVRVSEIGVGSGLCDECESPEDRTMRIVGRAVFPKLGDAGHNPTNLGEGAATTGNVFTTASLPDEKYTVVLVRLKPGADLEQSRDRLNRFFAPQFFCEGEPNCVQSAERPGDLSNFARIRGTALLLAAVLALIALALLVHVLVSSVRRRRRELAVLMTLGFVRRQVSAVTAWQATTIAGLALLVGVPVGLALGSVVWRLFADRLGVAPDVGIPVVALVVGIPATVVLANLAAAVPALLAARTYPATVLRSE